MKIGYFTFWVILIAGIFLSGYYGYWMGRTDNDVKVVGSTGVVRTILKKPPKDLTGQRNFYKNAFNAKPKYTHTVTNDWVFVLRTTDYSTEKHGIQIATKGNWKLYVGIAGLGVLTGAMIVWKF